MRTYDASGTLNAAVEIFTNRVKELFLAALIPVAVITIAGIFVGAAAASGSGGLAFILAMVTIVLAVVASAVATATCFRIVDAAYNGQQTTLRESIDFAMSRIGAVIGASILVGLAVLLGLVLCVAPGVFLLIAFSVTIPALLVEGLGSTQAMGRSFELVKDRWWATLGRLALAYLVIWVANFVVGIISAIAGDASWVVDIVIGIPVSALTTGFAAAIAVVVYYDLRARKEGAVGQPFAPAGYPAAPQAPQPFAPDAPSTSVAPPGAGWSAPAQTAPPAPPVEPPAATPAPPPPPPAPPAPSADPGTSASTGSLWSSGDPLQPPPPPATEPQWEPPAPQPPADGDDQPPSTPPPPA